MSSSKKAVNLSIRADLIEEARECKINLSQTLEVALATELKKEKERRWLEENQPAIEAYSRFVEKHGLLSDRYRNFARED
jgi:antitoxin CcdA